MDPSACIVGGSGRSTAASRTGARPCRRRRRRAGAAGGEECACAYRIVSTNASADGCRKRSPVCQTSSHRRCIGMNLDLEGRTLHGLTTFAVFVVLIILYLVTCLPVITIGAATSSLYEVGLRYADNERGDPLRDYLAGL